MQRGKCTLGDVKVVVEIFVDCIPIRLRKKQTRSYCPSRRLPPLWCIGGYKALGPRRADLCGRGKHGQRSPLAVAIFIAICTNPEIVGRACLQIRKVNLRIRGALIATGVCARGRIAIHQVVFIFAAGTFPLHHGTGEAGFGSGNRADNRTSRWGADVE